MPARTLASRLAVATAVLASALAGCGEPPSGTVAVLMYDNGYSPPLVRIPVGGRVIFRNMGRNQHHALALDESWSTAGSFGSLVMEHGETAEVVFDRPGAYRYYCTFHGSPLGDRGMVGTVLVGDAELPSSSPAAPPPVREASGTVLRVPEDFPRIQAAVDAARPGDLVLIGPGIYRESVRVTTPSLVLRGVDRNTVVLDGAFTLGNGVLVLADGVAIENMTARGYTLNGFYWTGATGYRGSFLTAYNNGDYGIYAFDSTDGLIEASYASGSPDAGFYVGQCYPCRTVLRGLLAENNGLGYSGTNAGGDLWIVDSTFRRNLAGVVPNTLDTELLPPQRETTILGNRVLDNFNTEAPAKGIVRPLAGSGIVIAGGRRNRIERNVVAGHPDYGVLLLPSADDRFWPVAGNVVRDNFVSGSGRADLAVAGPGAWRNCFAGNRAATTAPPALERLQACEGPRWPIALDAVPSVRAFLRKSSAAGLGRGDWRTAPAPPPQPQLPGGAAAPVRPAVDVWEEARIGLDRQELPAVEDVGGAASGLAPRRRLARAGAFLPAAIGLVWMGVALLDLRRRGGAGRAPWAAVIVLLPGLGAFAYLALGRPRLAVPHRLAWLAGALLLWIAALVAAALDGLALG